MNLFLEEYGLTLEEIFELQSVAEESVDAARAVQSRRILNHVSPETSEQIRKTLIANSFEALSGAGYNSLVQNQRDSPGRIQTLSGLLRNILVDPLMHRSVVSWCFYHALRESSESFQLNHFPSPTSEGVLTGIFLGEIANKCCVWREKAAVSLARVESTLSLKRIDLSILGGEQESGGDFGLVLEVDERVRQPNMSSASPDVRIVPLVIQAKRYVRPSADISQRHRTRGYQFKLLRQNPCASAYLFYENGKQTIEDPVQPLLKSVDTVSVPPFRTRVFDGSLDLSTYLLRALYSPSAAPGATSPEEALRMIYPRAHSGQLATLAVISSRADPIERYSTALVTIVREAGEATDHLDRESR